MLNSGKPITTDEAIRLIEAELAKPDLDPADRARLGEELTGLIDPITAYADTPLSQRLTRSRTNVLAEAGVKSTLTVSMVPSKTTLDSVPVVSGVHGPTKSPANSIV